MGGVAADEGAASHLERDLLRPGFAPELDPLAIGGKRCVEIGDRLFCVGHRAVARMLTSVLPE